MDADKTLSPKETHLLNRYQKSFPLDAHPFRVIAQNEGLSEQDVISTYRSLQDRQILSRIGPVFRPHVLGASTLAAMQVPADRLEEVADYVSSLSEVNHNYERENEINLWFVVTTENENALNDVLKKIENHTGIAVLDLRLEKEFRIDLGFDLNA